MQKGGLVLLTAKVAPLIPTKLQLISSNCGRRSSGSNSIIPVYEAGLGCLLPGLRETEPGSSWPRGRERKNPRDENIRALMEGPLGCMLIPRGVTQGTDGCLSSARPGAHFGGDDSVPQSRLGPLKRGVTKGESGVNRMEPGGEDLKEQAGSGQDQGWAECLEVDTHVGVSVWRCGGKVAVAKRRWTEAWYHRWQQAQRSTARSAGGARGCRVQGVGQVEASRSRQLGAGKWPRGKEKGGLGSPPGSALRPRSHQGQVLTRSLRLLLGGYWASGASGTFQREMAFASGQGSGHSRNPFGFSDMKILETQQHLPHCGASTQATDYLVPESGPRATPSDH